MRDVVQICEPGGRILDLFAGAGTTVLAAVQEGYEAVGIEMLNQSATDRAELAKLLNISDNQLGYVTNVPAGCGLIRCAGNIVPFTNSFPKNTKLYGLMTTKPDEVRKE